MGSAGGSIATSERFDRSATADTERKDGLRGGYNGPFEDLTSAARSLANRIGDAVTVIDANRRSRDPRSG